MHITCYPVSVMTGRPDRFGRTSGQGVFTMNFVFGPYLKISVSMCFCIYFDFVSWLCAYMFTWFIFVKILVASKFPKHIILHFEKVSIFRPLTQFQNFFNYAIWNFEMILKILFEKYFQNFPYSFQYSMCIIYFWKLYFSKDFPKRNIKLFLIGGENEFSISFKITYSILI